MPRVTFFREPEEEAMQAIVKAIKAEGVSRLARAAGMPERTAREWVEHPEKMRMQQGIALLMAAKIREDELARMLGGRRRR